MQLLARARVTRSQPAPHSFERLDSASQSHGMQITPDDLPGPDVVMCASQSLGNGIEPAAHNIGSNPPTASTHPELVMCYDAVESCTTSTLEAGEVRVVAAGARRWL